MDIPNALPGSYPQTDVQPLDTPVAGRVSRNATARPSFIATVQAAIHVVACHPLPVFACSVLLLAGAGVISSLMYVVLVGEAVAHTGWNTSTASNVYNLQLLAQAAIGTFTLFMGRGAMTWIALQADLELPAGLSVTPITLRAALRESLRRWQPLLVSSVFYGLLITLGTAGLSLLLRELRLDVSNARWLRGDLDSVLNWTLVRSINTLVPEPGAPFTEWIAATKYNLARTTSTGYFGFDYYSRFSSHDVPVGMWLLGAGSALCLIVCDAVLSVRTAIVFAGSESSHSTLGWLADSAHLGKRHFRRLVLWRWVLRLGTMVVVTTTLVLLPALHQMTVMNEVRQAIGTGYWPYYMAQAGYGFVGALVGSLLLAFSIIFDARMFLMLKHADR